MTSTGALRTIKVAHTIVWAFFVVCIAAIPVMAYLGNHGAAAFFTALVTLEVIVLGINAGRCPLTDVAARFTGDRRANFDIYLPEWLARYNKVIFGGLFVCGLAYSLLKRYGAY